MKKFILNGILLCFSTSLYASGYTADGSFINDAGHVYNNDGGYAGNIDGAGNVQNADGDSAGHINENVGIYDSFTDTSNIYEDDSSSDSLFPELDQN